MSRRSAEGGPASAQTSAAGALLTDLYQLTMLDAYYRLGMERVGVFELFVRRQRDTRNFMVAAGLEQVLDYLESLRFTPQELDWLASTQRFSDELMARLEQFRFTGNVFAMPEGTVFFASEPLLRIVAPLPEAQFVESRIINLMHYPILVASKAARCRLAAPHSALIDFGLRRSHGAEAALHGSRASHIAGFDATSNAEAARLFGIPPSSTMAHSFVQAHDLEAEAFRNFAAYQPQDLVVLIDTYDIARGAQRVAMLARELRVAGRRVEAVRIDSGELALESKRVREILDRHGCSDVRIFVSGDLDEHAIETLHAARAPIDAYYVGTRLSVSMDAPALDCVYTLQEYASRSSRKRSQWKESWPGPRQVYRQYDPHGRIGMDILACADEVMEGKALLREVMVNGRRTVPSPSLKQVRQHCAEELATLPLALRGLERGCHSPVKVSARQHELAVQCDRRPT